MVSPFIIVRPYPKLRLKSIGLLALQVLIQDLIPKGIELVKQVQNLLVHVPRASHILELVSNLLEDVGGGVQVDDGVESVAEGHRVFLIHHSLFITPYGKKVNPCFVNGLALTY